MKFGKARGETGKGIGRVVGKLSFTLEIMWDAAQKSTGARTIGYGKREALNPMTSPAFHLPVFSLPLWSLVVKKKTDMSRFELN